MPMNTAMPEDPKRAAMKEMLSDDGFNLKENPVGADMGKLFIDKALFPPDVKEGDQVKITATVGPVGSKVSITPLEAEMCDPAADEAGAGDMGPAGEAPGAPAPGPMGETGGNGIAE